MRIRSPTRRTPHRLASTSCPIAGKLCPHYIFWLAGPAALEGRRRNHRMKGESPAMPTYEYECTKCSHRFEEYQSITAEPLTACPAEGCRGKVKRLIGGGGGLLFKGSGFYITDYRSDGYKKAAKAEKTSSSGSGSSSSDSSSTGSTGSSSAGSSSTGSSSTGSGSTGSGSTGSGSTSSSKSD